MAKKKSTTKKRRTSRRRRVGSMDVNSIMSSVGGVVLGVVVGGYANKLVLNKMSPMMQALIPVGIGLFVPNFIKSDLGKFAGAGMIAYGASKFLASKGLGAIDDGMVTVPVRINGDDGSLSIVAGDDDWAMAGDDDDYGMSGDNDYGISGDYAMAGDISVLAGMMEEEEEEV